jgi:hypothetical protein
VRNRLRLNLLDVSAAVLVAIVLVMPGRALHVASAFRYVEPEDRLGLTSEIAVAQARLIAEPGDGEAAEDLSLLLARRPVNQHDQALRLAGTAAAEADSPTRWRALRAVSFAHADRLEISEAHVQATQALEACNRQRAACPDHERVRLELYVEKLTAGVEAIARGADPRADLAHFREEMRKIHPTATYRTRARQTEGR